MIITIDGPAGTGKSTIARRVANALGFLYVDTGAMYRIVTYGLLKDDVDVDDANAIAKVIKYYNIGIKIVGDDKRYYLNDEDITREIRSEKVTALVSSVSAFKSVREYLVGLQRHLSQDVDAVFEGRDMGTVVFPNAELKIYLTARPLVRAERRLKDLKNNNITLEQVLDSINKRDAYDSSREISPLLQAPDAHCIDTSDMTIEEVTEEILKLIPAKK